MIRYVQKTNSEDNNRDFRKRCKRVILENGAEICLFTDVASDTERHFTFAPLDVGLKMYEDTRWYNVNFKFKTIFRLKCRYNILISLVDSIDETRRLM